MKKASIVIDREYGSGGREVARLLAEKMGIKFYDGNLLVMASERYGIQLGIMQEHDEKRIGSLLYDIAMSTGNVNNFERMEAPYRIFQAQSEVVRQLAEEHQCIFLGRCADEILKGVTPILHVFIYASDMQQRIRRAEEVDQVTAKNVKAYINKKDTQRRNYYRYFTDRDWEDKNSYDLCINTSAVGYEKAADIILAAL